MTSLSHCRIHAHIRGKKKQTIPRPEGRHYSLGLTLSKVSFISNDKSSDQEGKRKAPCGASIYTKNK
jgi:hypothetical protein